MPKSGFNDGNEKPVSVKNDLRNVIMKEDCVQLLVAPRSLTMSKGFTPNLVLGLHSTAMLEVNSVQIQLLK